MHTAHVVEEVPSTWESISRNGAFTSFPQAEVGVISVAVESMGFALVAEEACVRGEAQLSIHASGDLAAVGLQVGVQVFAVGSGQRRVIIVGMGLNILVSALLRGGRVVAGLVSVGVGAVVLSIILGGQGIVVVLPWVTGLSTFLGSLTDWLSRGQWREEFLGLNLGLGARQSSSASWLGWPDCPT